MGTENSFLVLFLAPIKEYLEDDEVSEILINGPGKVYIEKHGKLQKTAAQFRAAVAVFLGHIQFAAAADRDELPNWVSISLRPLNTPPSAMFRLRTRTSPISWPVA